MESVPLKEIYSLQLISSLWLFISLLSSEFTVRPATFQKTPDGKEHRPTTVPTFPGTSKMHSTLPTQNQPSKELLTTVEIRGESCIFKVWRNELNPTINVHYSSFPPLKWGFYNQLLLFLTGLLLLFNTLILLTPPLPLNEHISSQTNSRVFFLEQNAESI